MKKKLLSLLLVAVILMTSVSVGFGTATFAAATGQGVESIKAFSLVDNNGTSYGTSVSTSITVKSKVSGYQIKVNSIIAEVIRYNNATDVLSNAVSVSDAAGKVCTTAGSTFTVTGTVASTVSGLIRYTCNYDLQNSSGTTLYSSLTGYGYGYIEGSGNKSGTATSGSYCGTPTTSDDYSFNSFSQLQTWYAQVGELTLSYQSKTAERSFGVSNTNSSLSLSGDYPGTLSVAEKVHWDGAGNNSSATYSANWLTLTTPTTSGWWKFSVYSGGLDGSATWNSEILYRTDSDKSNALNAANDDLALCLEKSYYTTDSWNNYLAALEAVELAARAVPGYNYAFQTACSTAASVSSTLSTAKSNLVPVSADYSELDDAIADFNAKKAETVEIRTYSGGVLGDKTSGVLGTTTILKYTDASIAAGTNYINTLNMGLMKYNQSTVDGYVTQVNAYSDALVLNDADYSYLDIALAEYDAFNSAIFETASWKSYTNRINIGINIQRGGDVTLQADINTALNGIISTKQSLKYGPADLTYLEECIVKADEVIDDYENGRVFANADGFTILWAEFAEAYNVATDIKEDHEDGSALTGEYQSSVDTASANLAAAIDSLSNYRLLNVDELQGVSNQVLTESADKFEPDTYNLWVSLKEEGMAFVAKAAATYTGEDRKTYSDMAERDRLTQLIIDAKNNLKKVKADFTELYAALEKIPPEEELALYKDEIVQGIKDVIATINYGATYDEQDIVDEIAENLNAAVLLLVPANYKDADYTIVDEAIARAGQYEENVDLYTEESWQLVQDKIAEVDRTLKIVEQDSVNAMADAINEALDNIIYIGADYTSINEAIAAANAVENKDWYGNYSRVETLIENIDWDKSIIEQADVDAYAEEILKAIDALEYAEADYSGVRSAIEDANALEPLTDFTDESVANLDSAIANVVAGYKANQQDAVNAMETEIRDAIEKMELLPADYSEANAAIAYAESHNPDEYSNYKVVQDAIDALDRNLNCRQTDLLAEQVTAIYTAVGSLNLLPANYDALNKAIEDARYAYNNGLYPYTEESKQAVEDVIETINWDYDIKSQAAVDAYIPLIEAAVAKLDYVRANYDEFDAIAERVAAIDRKLWAGVDAIDAYISTADKTIKADRQAEVDAMVATIEDMILKLEYADADYSAVDAAVKAYNSVVREYYSATDLIEVDKAYRAVEYGLKANQQEDVTKMATDLNAALETLATKIKPANLDNLNAAAEAANAKYLEMQQTGNEIEQDSVINLSRLLGMVDNYQGSNIDSQAAIDALTEQIIEATNNLEFVFAIDLEGTGLIVDGNYIFGFEEGAFASDVEELIKFVGAAEMKITETKNGFGTGSVIQFISTKDGSVLLSYTVVFFGDANGDCVIDMFDVAYLVELQNSGAEPTDFMLKILDLDNSGYLDATDLSVLIALANMTNTLIQDGNMTVI